MIYFTKQHLIECAQRAEEWDYNRRVRLAPIEALPEGAQFPVLFYDPHEHRRGEPCEIHFRCVVQMTKEETLIVDVPFAFMDALPRKARNGRKTPME